MIQAERRFEVRLISPDSLVGYMSFRGYTVRALAEKAGCSPTAISFLRTGKRKTCRPNTARAIAKALDCPVESLFVPRTSIVRRKVAA